MVNMNIQSIYDVNDRVWVFRNEDNKFYEGTIKEVQSWDKWNGFRYEVIHHSTPEITINVEEAKIFNSREEIINTRFIVDPTLS